MMLNFRRLKQEFSSAILQQGKALFAQSKVVFVEIVDLRPELLRINGRIVGQYDNCYETQLEIERLECQMIDSDCDCPSQRECPHLAALLFYFEHHCDDIVAAYKQLQDSAAQRPAEVGARQREESTGLYQQQLLREYQIAAELLASSPFFSPQQQFISEQAELALLLDLPPKEQSLIEFQIALRLPSRSKPLHIPDAQIFFASIRDQEPLAIAGKNYCFSIDSFAAEQKEIMQQLLPSVYFLSGKERSRRSAWIDRTVLGRLLAVAYLRSSRQGLALEQHDSSRPVLSPFYANRLETPIRFSPVLASLSFAVEYLPPPTQKVLIKPLLLLEREEQLLEETFLLSCQQPGVLFQGIYYQFSSAVTPYHLKSLPKIGYLTIPEALLGTFIENALPQLTRCAEVRNQEVLQQVSTLPYLEPLKGYCQLTYLRGQLEAELFFYYRQHKVPAAAKRFQSQTAAAFISDAGIFARNLVEERALCQALFEDFLPVAERGSYITKSEKKIIEFMTQIVPRYRQQIHFACPQNLLDRFTYDQSTFTLSLQPGEHIDTYVTTVGVDGDLQGVPLDLLWECVRAKRPFLEMQAVAKQGAMQKILIFDLGKMQRLVPLFEALGIRKLEAHTVISPLWNLVHIDAEQFAGLPIALSIAPQLEQIRQQIVGPAALTFSPLGEIEATLRPYQRDGVRWLEKLRKMHLGGILADDMGLGKSLQAIVAICQQMEEQQQDALIICPTSLLYNWKEEIAKFASHLPAVVIDGHAKQRQLLLRSIGQQQILITSYALLQKDLEWYQQRNFGYVVLDEAQHIKNQRTHRAQSVKQLRGQHRLILSGTPIENSLEDLWSLFDFLMPGFLGPHSRFMERYVRLVGEEQKHNLADLRRKIAPFVLRRMKREVLHDLPPICEVVHYCRLTATQEQLYKSYACSARSKLIQLVEREGFANIRLHVVATLTRLKQICCHPAIFAKEMAEAGDSAKYEMLLELVQNLASSGHKSVIFSQYTRMLAIMREDFTRMGLQICYLDGTSRNRFQIVQRFNEDQQVTLFLVSLKAGGTGLNLVAADTVIHYDMWWNPAVENQATDRVHRIGQQRAVSSYKLVTLGTLEEKIVEMQKRKQGMAEEVISSDAEAISRLTWEEVLELLKT